MIAIIPLIIGLFAGSAIPLTSIHQKCIRGDVAACEMDKQINPYAKK
jgi:hypothetical protein